MIPVDEYLSSSYRPDMEYVDGCLVPHAAPNYLHSLLQAILIAYLRQFEKQLGYKSLPELRTQIVERARYRIPDVLLCATPTRVQTVMNEIPLVVVEILSPGDTVTTTLQRFRDYERIGVPYIIQLDPEARVAHRFEQGSLIETAYQELRIGLKTIPFDTERLFADLDREVADAANVTPSPSSTPGPTSPASFRSS